MTEKPLVSVIINCYNSEKYLRETIDSLIAQTYDNWEAIFWDNCSTDKTAEIIASYNEPRFRYFLAEKNTPLGEARNLAMEKVQGEMLCFLDSDDVWLKDFLKIGVSSILNNGSVIGFYSNYYNWHGNDCKENNKGRLDGVHSYRYILSNYGIGMSACIVKNSVRNTHKISFDNNFSLVEDLDFFLNFLRFGDFSYCSKPLYYYRITTNNTSHKSKREWAEEYHRIYEKLLERDVTQDSLGISGKDLSRIKYFESMYVLECFIEQNQRKEAFLYMMKNKVPFRFLSRFLFVVLGRDLYNKLRG